MLTVGCTVHVVCHAQRVAWSLLHVAPGVVFVACCNRRARGAVVFPAQSVREHRVVLDPSVMVALMSMLVLEGWQRRQVPVPMRRSPGADVARTRCRLNPAANIMSGVHAAVRPSASSTKRRVATAAPFTTGLQRLALQGVGTSACIGTGPSSPTSAPGLGSPLPHPRHRPDRAPIGRCTVARSATCSALSSPCSASLPRGAAPPRRPFRVNKFWRLT